MGGKGKPGFLTPKAIANRIKSKGLQKLRWYCQMCQKQCRDENGFKCHTMSESHQRQLLLFADNQKRFMDEFSGTFKSDFLLTLRRRFGTKRVNANAVYQEYISDRNHIHMNATRWLTLTRFVQYLGREGICVVDQTEKGWFITYIDRDPETLRRQEELEKKRKLEVDDRETQIRFIEKQIEREKERKSDEVKPQYTELLKTESDEIKITIKKPKRVITSTLDVHDEAQPVIEDIDEYLVKSKIDEANENSQEGEKEQTNVDDDSMPSTSMSIKPQFKNPNLRLFAFKKPDLPISTTSSNSATSATTTTTSQSVNITKSISEKRKPSALEEIMKSKEVQREKQNRKDHWLHKNIVVKIVTNKLGEKYLNKKGIVMSIKDVYIGIIKLIEMDSIIKVDQAHLETVIPAIGKRVMIVNGAYRGLEAILEDINERIFSARVSIASGPLKGRIVDNVQYEDISKLNEE